MTTNNPEDRPIRPVFVLILNGALIVIFSDGQHSPDGCAAHGALATSGIVAWPAQRSSDCGDLVTEVRVDVGADLVEFAGVSPVELADRDIAVAVRLCQFYDLPAGCHRIGADLVPIQCFVVGQQQRGVQSRLDAEQRARRRPVCVLVTAASLVGRRM
jgi:hypothetical protein